MAKSIVLIGMSGVGKSTIGKALSKSLGWQFIDGDTVIESEEGQKLQAIIDEKGLESFKKIEEATLLNMPLNDTIIAPGGSLIYYDRVMQLYRDNCQIVFLKNKLTNIKRNIKNFDSRGIVGLKAKTFDELYEERSPLYEANAHYTLDMSTCALSKAHLEIEKLIQDHTA